MVKGEGGPDRRTNSAFIQGWLAREGPVPRTQAGLSCAVPAFNCTLSRLSKKVLMRPTAKTCSGR